MAQDRIAVCKYYICAGQCEKGREANYYRYCQKCDLYKPRTKLKSKNRKRVKLEKIRNREWKDQT